MKTNFPNYCFVQKNLNNKKILLMQKLKRIFTVSGKHAMQQKGGASTAQTTVIVNEGARSGFLCIFLAFSATVIGYNVYLYRQLKIRTVGNGLSPNGIGLSNEGIHFFYKKKNVDKKGKGKKDLSFYHNVLKHLIDKIFMESQVKMEEVLDSSNIVEDKTVHSISENKLLLLLFHNSLLSRVSNTINNEKITIIDIARLANVDDIAINHHDISECYSQDTVNRDNVQLETDVGDIILSLDAMFRKLVGVVSIFVRAWNLSSERNAFFASAELGAH
ncbi:hypothetical protein RFI_02410 [Reticulomyxa filosa]|uniref:Uncharacterized protein n=1 Tax=Reticulomyxa filosa TaxID=46433 RepID=X6P9D3_RETFI|nr:hypothetical protein RFI_02410 [Reticulomyxa filosa]|eukprot:ETO34679.1 hypothetical protein RFI_02410 [Reticulomyxa filosa]